MEEHLEIDYLICKGFAIDIKNPHSILYEINKEEPKSKADLFKKLVLDNGFSYQPGSYFVKMDFFDKVNSKREIYDAGIIGGQNIQMMIPIVYFGRYGFLDEALFDYVLHDDNHHNRYKDSSYRRVYLEDWKNLWHETLCGMDLEEKKRTRIENLVVKRILYQEFDEAFYLMDYIWLKEIASEIDDQLSMKQIIKLAVVKSGLWRFYPLYISIRRKL